MTEQPPTFGRDLLARARARGVTGEEVATLLGLPVSTIRRLSGAHQLDRHAAATLRALARRLDLPWPPWLHTAPSWPPAAAGTRSDTARVHAVLAAAFGHALRLGEIALVLGWSIDRVRAAVTQLTARRRHDGGTRLHANEDTVSLEIAPGPLDDGVRRRLSQDPGPLDEACVLGLLTRDIDEATGTVTDVELHPDVKFSLGITSTVTRPRIPQIRPVRTHDPAAWRFSMVWVNGSACSHRHGLLRLADHRRQATASPPGPM